VFSGKHAGGPDDKQKKQVDAGAIGAVVFGPTRAWWVSLMTWWPTTRSRHSQLCPANPRSGPSVSAFMRAWQTEACRRWASSPCRIPSRRSRHSLGRFKSESEAHRAKGEYARVYVFHNRPKSGALYEPVSQRLLPLDAQWLQGLAKVPWPSGNLPEVMGGGTATLRALIREYLFISLFRACAESLASENASRLAAMQRADKNIDELPGATQGDISSFAPRRHRRGIVRRHRRLRSAFQKERRIRSPDDRSPSFSTSHSYPKTTAKCGN